MQRLIFIIAMLFVTAMMSTSVQAVQTVYVEHSSEKQFKDGDPNGVIINSEGEIYLANETETLLKDPNGQWVFNALAMDNNGTLYAATSGKGQIYRFKQGRQDIIYSGSPGEQAHIFSLAIDNQGQLLAGVSAKKAALLRFDENGKPQTLWTDPQVKYIWSIVVGPAGRIYLATGPTGKVITLNAAGANPELLYKSKEKNILSLALGRDGLIYAGGDELGLVYKIDPGSKRTTILYDTGHREISGLVFDEKGNLYVSTGDSDIRMPPGSRLVLANGDISRSEASANKNNKNNKPSAKPSAKPDTVKKTAEPSDEDDGDDGDGDDGNDDTELIPAETKQPGPELPKMPLFPEEGLLKKPTSVNEVYKIAPDGYTDTIFSKAVVILTMVYSSDGKLLLGTGNQGHLLKLDIETQEAEILHTAKPSLQIASLLIRDDATILAGCANPAALMAIKPTYKQTGNYVSPVIDAAQPSQWGKIQIKADIPAGASLAVSSRSGNTQEPDRGGWQEWTTPRPVSEDLPILSAVGRFLQYRLELSSTQGNAGAIVKSVKLAHLVPNLPPKIKSLEVTRTEKASGPGRNESSETEISKTMQVTWQCNDENNDKLIYNIYIRPLGTDRWVRIAKEIKEPEYKWDSRTIADGRYELKVEASDKPANPAGTQLTDSRVSKIIVVDNTPPGVDEVNYHLTDNILYYNASLSDELSVIAAIDYILDSQQQWQPGLPVDGVFDSRSEKVKFECEITDQGEHLLAVRFTDAMGNKSYRNFTVIVPDKTNSSDKEKNVGKQENQQN